MYKRVLQAFQHILNNLLIPDIYCKVETVRTPDKTRIKKAIKSGEDVAGAVLVEKNNIHIGQARLWISEVNCA